jgi:hypothetical protein
MTPETTRKFSYLSDDPRVALLINNSLNLSSDIYRAAAVTAIGKAQVVQGQRKMQLTAMHLEKHPHLKDFARADTTAVVQVLVDRYFLVENFQNVIELRML